jgi:molybdenum cofactor cytidylyltransferase
VRTADSALSGAPQGPCGIMTFVVRAIVLAAGASSRMGRPKAGLPLSDGADTFLSRLLRTFTAAGIPDIVVVTGSSPDAVRAAAGRVRHPVRFEYNARWTDGQLTSLLTGLRERPGDVVEAALVMLVDAPLVTPATVARLVKTWREHRAPIVRPARGDEHGHPVLFDRALFGELRAADPTRGAKAVVRAHAAEIVNVPVDDPGAFLDIDTDAEYREALRGLRQ